MATADLLEQISAARQSFFDEGLIDKKQLKLCEEMATDGKKDFVVHTFILEIELWLEDLEIAISKTPIIKTEIEDLLAHLAETSKNFGAIKVNEKLDKAIESDREGDLESTMASIEEMKGEFLSLRTKLDAYIELIKDSKSNTKSGDEKEEPETKSGDENK